jgi:hypothetical protein
MLLRVGRREGDRGTTGTITIDLKLPLDGSLTSLLIHEGLLYLLNEAGFKRDTPARRFTLNKDDIVSALGKLEGERLESMDIASVGKNDNQSIIRLLDRLGVSRGKKGAKITKFSELLKLIMESSKKLTISNEIEIAAKITEGKMFIGVLPPTEEEGRREVGSKKKSKKGKKKAVARDTVSKGITLQLFKTERYTGLTSSEHSYTDRQLTTYMSPETALLGLLGLYSSFVTTSENMHYMLFFSPEEASYILSGSKDLRTMFLLKDKVRNTLEKIIRKGYSEELIVAETLLNIELQGLLRRYNIRSVMFILLRLARERQTYKVYQHLPLAFYERGEREQWLGLAEIIDPDGVVLTRLSRSNNPEYSNLISVIMGVYRYVILGDRAGLYTAIRELHNAYVKVSNKKEGGNVAKRYASLLHTLSSLARQM